MGSTFSSSETIRTIMVQKRKSLTPSEILKTSQIITEKLLNRPDIQTAEHIALYLSHQNEVDLLPLVQKLWALKKSIYLPILHPVKPGHLCFAPYQSNTPLIQNKYKILEPEYCAQEIIAPWELDLVLMPLVGFDDHGNRIGMGGGYYDRTFQFKALTKIPLLIGCAYEWQQVSSIESQPWDVPLDAVVTG